MTTPRGPRLYLYQFLLLVALFALWHGLTATDILAPFFFGRPLAVLQKVWEWFAGGKFYSHLAITLWETVLAFGAGIWSKVALGVTLVFFIVFFNVYQGVREVSRVVLANARMLGAGKRQLMRHVYLPSATSWVFSSPHTSVGMAFVGVVGGEYLGSSAGVGYLILQAEGAFDTNTVFAGILVLTAFALILDSIVTFAEKRLLVWQPRAGQTEGK